MNLPVCLCHDALSLLKLLTDHICLPQTLWLPITWQTAGMQQIHVQLINENPIIEESYHMGMGQTTVMSKEKKKIHQN